MAAVPFQTSAQEKEMTVLYKGTLDPPMTDTELEMARVAQRCLVEALDRSRAAVITVKSEQGDQPPLELPPQALKIIAQILGALSERRPIMLMPAKQEMTTIEAANYLNVSRPFVIKEIEAGRLKHRMVGTHRRIEFDELQAYAHRMRQQQQGALLHMAENARELGLDY
jgi:excisionase family DNA binding protein